MGLCKSFTTCAARGGATGRGPGWVGLTLLGLIRSWQKWRNSRAKVEHHRSMSTRVPDPTIRGDGPTCREIAIHVNNLLSLLFQSLHLLLPFLASVRAGPDAEPEAAADLGVHHHGAHHGGGGHGGYGHPTPPPAIGYGHPPEPTYTPGKGMKRRREREMVEGKFNFKLSQLCILHFQSYGQQRKFN